MRSGVFLGMPDVCTLGVNPKPAIEVTTGFSPSAPLPETDRRRTASASEAHREAILLELS